LNLCSRIVFWESVATGGPEMFELFIAGLYIMDRVQVGVFIFSTRFQHFYTKPYLSSSHSTTFPP